MFRTILFLFLLSTATSYNLPSSRRSLLKSSAAFLPVALIPSFVLAETDVLRSRQLSQNLKYLKSQSTAVQSADYPTLKSSLRNPPFDTIRKTMRGTGLNQESQKVYDRFIKDIEVLDNKLTRFTRFGEEISVVGDWEKACRDLEEFVKLEGGGVSVE